MNRFGASVGELSAASIPVVRRTGLLIGLLLWVPLLFTGCENLYNVKVDGIRDQRMEYPTGTPYVLLTPPKGATGQEVNGAKAEAMVKTALATKGYFPVDSVNEADLVVTVEYGLTPGRVSFKQRRVLKTPSIGVYDIGYRTYPGIIPIPSSEEQIVSQVVSTKYITFSARDPRKVDRNGKPVEVWNLVVKVEDRGEDLQEYLPILLAASLNYLGENTGEQLELKVDGESEAVQYVLNDATFEVPPL